MEFLMDLFPKILDMSITASIVVLVVIAARLLLKKAPKVISYALWGVVLLRLLCPFSFESAISIVPNVPEIEQTNLNTALPDIDFETYSDWEANRITLEQSTGSESVNVTIKHSADPTLYLSIIWIAGIAAMLAYSVVSYIRLRRKFSIAVPLRDNIFIADDVKSPFVVGFVRPRIYLPGGLGEKEQEYIILHEQHHICRGDHIVKLLAFAALSIHWFNPLVWLAFVLSSKDMEMSCDEAVIRKAGEEIRADYSASLLTLATGRRIFAGAPLAFGEGDTTGRIKNLSAWKKPVLWVVIAAVIGCVLLAACLLTNRIAQAKLPPIGPRTYTITEVTHESMMTSFQVVPGINTPVYTVTSGKQLLSREHNEDEWKTLGVLNEFELTKENFDDLLRGTRWSMSGSASSFRRNNIGAWKLVYNQEILYYILQQKNGEVYMCYGIYDYSEKDDPYSDDTWISHIYRLSSDISEDMGLVAASGERSVPVVVFPSNTTISEVKDEVFWLDIVPGEDDTVPFSIYCDGREQFGFFSIYDAQTLESLAYFHPSGLSPQTYLFQNAEQGKDYIITMRTSMTEITDMYCFGAHLGESSSHEPPRDTADSNTVGTNLTDFAYEAAYAWVNYSEEGYDAMVERAENRDTERRYGNVEHLTPVVKIESKADFDEFHRGMAVHFSFEHGYDDVPSFNQQAERYTSEFFENNTLFIAYLEEPTDANRHEVEEVRIENGVLEIRICRIAPQSGDSLMAGWFAAVSVPKDTIAKCIGYDAYICAEVDPDSVFPSSPLVRSYHYDGGDISHMATVSLYEDGSFQFTFSPLSSYIAMGTYIIENDRLILKTDDGMFVYEFDMVDDTLVFDAEASSEQRWFSGLTDGSVLE